MARGITWVVRTVSSWEGACRAGSRAEEDDEASELEGGQERCVRRDAKLLRLATGGQAEWWGGVLCCAACAAWAPTRRAGQGWLAG